MVTYTKNKYPIQHFYTVDDLYTEASYIPKGVCKNYTVTSKRRVAKKIFIDFLELLIDHIIETGDTFIFPYSKSKIKICPAHTKVLHTSRYKDVDVFTTNFTVYRMYLMTPKYVRAIHLDSKRLSRIIELANKGKKY